MRERERERDGKDTHIANEGREADQPDCPPHYPPESLERRMVEATVVQWPWARADIDPHLTEHVDL